MLLKWHDCSEVNLVSGSGDGGGGGDITGVTKSTTTSSIFPLTCRCPFGVDDIVHERLCIQPHEYMHGTFRACCTGCGRARKRKDIGGVLLTCSVAQPDQRANGGCPEQRW